MSLFERLIAFWASMWGLLPGLDQRRLVPLGPPVRPTSPAEDLIADADAKGVLDANAAMQNAWLFGGPGDQESVTFDPPYILQLRADRNAAIQSARAARWETDQRIAPARASRDEAVAQMAGARTRMSGMAMREERDEARAFAATDPDDPAVPGTATEPDATTGDEHTPWEGESTPLPLIWRLLILAGLVAAELPVQFYVFDYFLGPSSAGPAWWQAVMTAAIVVFGPFVAGALLRSRAATGADRWIGYIMIVFVVSWLFAIAVLGLVRGRLFEARAGALRVGPVTVVLMFVALLLVVGAMSLMLGVARRHPIQEAYVRSRARRDHFETVMRTAAVQLNPAYYDPADEPGTPDPRERAITEAYQAAEHAYFAALCRTIGDPVFTEAVQHRRGLRAAS